MFLSISARSCRRFCPWLGGGGLGPVMSTVEGAPAEQNGSPSCWLVRKRRKGFKGTHLMTYSPPHRCPIQVLQHPNSIAGGGIRTMATWKEILKGGLQKEFLLLFEGRKKSPHSLWIYIKMIVSGYWIKENLCIFWLFFLQWMPIALTIRQNKNNIYISIK